MTASELYAMVMKKEYNAVLDELERLPPSVLNEFAEEFIKHNQNAGDDFIDRLSDEQYERFKYLGSSERQRKYFMRIPDDKMTEKDWAELRATDF